MKIKNNVYVLVYFQAVLKVVDPLVQAAPDLEVSDLAVHILSLEDLHPEALDLADLHRTLDHEDLHSEVSDLVDRLRWTWIGSLLDIEDLGDLRMMVHLTADGVRVTTDLHLVDGVLTMMDLQTDGDHPEEDLAGIEALSESTRGMMMREDQALAMTNLPVSWT